MYPKCIIVFACLLIANLAKAQQSSRGIPADAITVPIPISTSDTIFTTVDSEAMFPGGMLGWRAYTKKNLRGQVPIENNAKPGNYNVRIRFTVNQDGTTNHFEKLTSFGHGMEHEVIRVIELGPKWIPASKEGKIVKSYKEQEMVFVVYDVND